MTTPHPPSPPRGPRRSPTADPRPASGGEATPSRDAPPGAASDSRSTPAPAFQEHIHRIDRLWRRHGRTFWILHSIWALATGAVILWLAHERYDFVYWVAGFLALTWASTLFFSRPKSGAREVDEGKEEAGIGSRFGRGLASYLTRVMYQETLFFLLPFYAYSTVVPSWNLFFPCLLGLLAVLACLDLVFDRWLRESPVFGLVFFASVAFAALNLLVPMLFSVEPAVATPAAAVVALVTAVPLALQQRASGRGTWLRTGAAAVAILVVAVWARELVPPVPLRLRDVAFAPAIDHETLETRGVVEDGTASDTLSDLVVLARVFAPTKVPSRIGLDWYRGGELVRSSREVEILAHEGGFRVWDAISADDGGLGPGVYRVVLRTADGRVFGGEEVLLR